MSKFKDYFKGETEDERYLGWLADNADSVSDEMEEVFEALCRSSGDIRPAYSSVDGRIQKDSQRRRRRSVFGYAAAFAAASIVLVCGFFIGRGSAKPQSIAETRWQELRVPDGETRRLELSDGTRLRLSPGSRITWPECFRDSTRRIFLDGEAVLQVAHDPEHPFIVQAGDMQVNVLGTTFSIKSYGTNDCEEVLLMEGSVRLKLADGKSVTMHPGNVVQYDRRSGQVSIDNFDVSTFKSFDDGESIHFFNMTLSDIAADLQRMFGTRIVVADSKLAGTRYFAIFNNGESLYDILRTLNTEKRMKIEKKDQTIYLTRK